MPYTISGATVYGVYVCSHCGASGDFSMEGDEYADGSFGVMELYCPDCGEDLDSEPEDDEDDEDE